MRIFGTHNEHTGQTTFAKVQLETGLRADPFAPLAVNRGQTVLDLAQCDLPDLAAATKIWRRMFPTEEHLAKNGLEFMKSRWQG